MGRFEEAMKNGVNAVTNWTLANRTPDDQSVLEARKFVYLNALAATLIPAFALYYAALDLGVIALALCGAGLVMLLSLPVYRATGNPSFTRDTFLAALFLFLIFATVWFGGLISPTAFWFAVIPVVGVLLGGTTAGIAWIGLVTVAMAGMALLDQGMVPQGTWPAHLYATSLIGMSMAVFLFVMMIDNDRKRTFAQLHEANRAINELAQRDSLTGLYNRRYVWDALRKAEETASSSGQPFAIILADVDNFKRINDRYGHVVGDVVLRSVAEAMTTVSGLGQLCGRYGGEEFLVLMESAPHDAIRLAAAVRDRVAELSFEHVAGPSQVTISVGVSELNPGEHFGEAFRRADAALYRAKAGGRNRVFSEVADVTFQVA